ncbi:MAG TPA: DinB family protein [Rhizomicrobium sp.]|jgi:uncharacterized damage-inducible protein DinB
MTGPLQAHFRQAALYNRWANTQIYAVAATLSPEQLAEDRGGFFKSLLGVLNHLVVTDRLWMSRLEGNSPRGAKLDEILHADMSELRAARDAENARIVGHVFALSEEQLTEPFAYETTIGAPQTQPRSHILAHLFNHHTHHRGQAHDLFGQIAGRDKAPPLDLLIYQRFTAPNDQP